MTGERPTRESLREVKREYRQRQRAAKRPPKPPKPHRERARNALAALGGVALLVGVVAGGVALTGGPPKPPRAVAGRVPVVVPTTPAPTPTPTKRPADDPFRGSTVSHWPLGAAGLATPRAVAIAPFSARQVAAAYAATSRYLRAAMLDERVLYGGDLRPVLATLDRRTDADSPVSLANVFRRDVVRAHRGVRVNGVVSARVAKRRLYVDFRYVAVYALRPARGGATELVAVRRQGTLLFDEAGAGVSPAWLDAATYMTDHSVCGAGWPDGDRTLEVWLPLRSASRPVTASPTATFNLIDPRVATPPKGCYTNTGTL
ncbi:MAG TPA: hypothetical protein VGX28_14250 [Frankiaceae bacterium]|jgi:hypothetical protein|nr:hypothetical protein [Frankiaceae bacterium]